MIDALKLKIEWAFRVVDAREIRIADAIAHHAIAAEVRSLRAELGAARRTLRRLQDQLGAAMRAGR